MIQETHLITANLIRASKKLGEIHTQFSTQGEKDAVYDFARMLTRRIIRVRTARDFVTVYEKAVTDIRDKNKVPEVWDESTVGFVHELMPFVARELFGVSFAKEVECVERVALASSTR